MKMVDRINWYCTVTVLAFQLVTLHILSVRNQRMRGSKLVPSALEEARDDNEELAPRLAYRRHLEQAQRAIAVVATSLFEHELLR